jgi:hypothetical protein
MNTLCGQNVEFLNVKTGGTYGDHWALERVMSVIKTSQLMLYRETVAVCSRIQTKHINTLCEQKTEFLNIMAGGTYSDHWALQG